MCTIETFIDDIILIDNYSGILDTPLQSPFTYSIDKYSDDETSSFNLSHKDLDIELNEYIGMEYLRKYGQINLNLLNENVLSDILFKVYTNNLSKFGKLDITQHYENNLNYIINYSLIKSWIDCRDDIYEYLPLKHKIDTTYIKLIFYTILYCKYNSEFYFETVRKNFLELLKLKHCDNPEEIFKEILFEYDLTNTFNEIIIENNFKNPPLKSITPIEMNFVKTKLKREDHTKINYNIRPITRSMTKKIKELI